MNIIYLPREKHDNLKVNDNVHVHKKVLNGLDLCYYSKGVLTGSGTIAREAACMGVNAASFFPNKNLLSVDRDLINKNKLFHSLEPSEIIEYILQNKNQERSLEKSINVKVELLDIVKSIIENSC